MTPRNHWLSVIGLLVMLAACQPQPPATIPTLIPSIDALATSVMMTENAPPVGFRESVSFERIDQHLRQLEGWRYTVRLDFDGLFSQTSRETSATAEATVWFNQVGDARRVLVESNGELFQRTAVEQFEAVQLGPDAFLVRRGVCLSNAVADARLAASLSAADLVGGVRRSIPTGRRERINGADVWEYNFLVEDVSLPSVRFAEDTRITRFSGELWVDPVHNAAVRYYVTLSIENARLLESTLPVSGDLRLRYDLYDIGQIPNISVPFGC
ncbi:MAG: hypothetical protein ACOYL5_02785 [Phototrophicaceae bacterium]